MHRGIVSEHDYTLVAANMNGRASVDLLKPESPMEVSQNLGVFFGGSLQQGLSYFWGLYLGPLILGISKSSTPNKPSAAPKPYIDKLHPFNYG